MQFMINTWQLEILSEFGIFFRGSSNWSAM